MYLPHPEPYGPIGGALYRTVEILKRARKHGINYFVIENKPSFKQAFGLEYEGCEISINGYPRSIFSYCKMMIELTLAGLEKCNNMDLIVSPLESPFCVFPAYLTSKITSVPWTTVLQSVPGYWSLPDESLDYTSKFSDLYRYVGIHRQFKDITLATLTRWLMYKVLRDTTALTVSKSIAEDIQRFEKIRIEEIFPGNAIDVEKISTIPAQRERTYDAIFAAAILPGKGIFDAIQAWSLIAKKRPFSRIVIVGKGNKDIVRKVKSQIRRLALENNVVLPYDLMKGAPSLSELWSLMKQSRILIHPSTLDAWSLVIGEAFACGLPVVAYDINATKYTYGDCPALFCVKRGDVEGLATKALELLENGFLKQYADQATRFKHYSWDDVVESEKNAYLNLKRRR